MYALHVTYPCAVPVEHLREAHAGFAGALTAVPGFVSKTWLHDGTDRGGFYLFADRERAEAFAGSPMLGALRANPAVADVSVRGYDVLEVPVP